MRAISSTPPSFGPQRNNRIDARGAAGGNVAGNRGDRQQRCGRGRIFANPDVKNIRAAYAALRAQPT
jgi:hypothetical protein